MNHTPTSDPFQIREARESDCGLILQFVQELAAYEKLADLVVATEDKLRQQLFGEHPAAEVQIAECGDQPAGFALYYCSFSTFLAQPGIWLEDLYVRPAFRGQGIGKGLLQSLARIAVQRGCGRLEWSVLDWNTPAIDFYKSLNARQMTDWIGNRLSGEDLERVASG